MLGEVGLMGEEPEEDDNRKRKEEHWYNRVYLNVSLLKRAPLYKREKKQ